MSDTVKLIIEIPKAMYEDIKSEKDGYSNYVHTAIRNGTPLDDVKAEIREQQKEYQEWGWAYDDVLEILDNIGKAEKHEICKGCLEPCIMYEPDMRACKHKVTEKGGE